MSTAASLFTGGGLADMGIAAAGFDVRWGVEYDRAIAAHTQAALGHPVYPESVIGFDWQKVEPVDLLWMSPPCQAFSTANANKGETAESLELARACCDAIAALQPRWVVLENVEGYRKSESFAAICDCLSELGYWVSWGVYDAADYGVPQNRRRLILRAIHSMMVHPLPFKRSRCGWYDAIADLLPNLPDAKVPRWLAPHVEKAMQAYAPPILVERQGARSDRPPQMRQGHEPVWTLRASVGANGARTFHYAALKDRVVALDARCLARLQTVPDWYPLPTDARTAGRVIGNGVPCEFARAIGCSFLF